MRSHGLINAWAMQVIYIYGECFTGGIGIGVQMKYNYIYVAMHAERINGRTWRERQRDRARV
jgi:hypothetical protein